MSPTGRLSSPKSRMAWVLGVQVLWLALAVILMGWWGWLLLEKNEELMRHRQTLGLSGADALEVFRRTQRMLFWEGGTFLVLFASIGAFLFYLYWRDAARQRGLQAFFASVTHELRTPLTSIRLQAESLQDGVQSIAAGEKLMKLTTRLLEDTQRLESQVERTLELARLEGGGPLYNQSVPLAAWIDRWLPSVAEAYGARARVRLESQPDPARVEADLGALQVVMKNLLENSIRHSGREPVELTLKITRSDESRIRLEARDNGEANPSDSDKRMGELFEKGSRSTGAGVGLYLVRSLMERMGGRAEFHARERGFPVTLEFREARDGGENG